MAVMSNIAPPLVSGFVFQQYNLVPTLSAYETIALPWRLDRRRPDRELIMDRMESMGIADLARKLPITLSGGEQQRVARDPGQCVLMVTHDPVVARRCDRVAFMRLAGASPPQRGAGAREWWDASSGAWSSLP